MLKKNIIKATMQDVDYCCFRLNYKSFKTVIDYANFYLPISSKFRIRRFYERKKGFIEELKQSLKEILNDEIEEIELKYTYRYIHKVSSKAESIIHFFELLSDCLSIDKIENKKGSGIILFKKLISNHSQKRTLD